MTVTKAEIQQAVEGYRAPNLQIDLLSAGALIDLTLIGHRVCLEVELSYPAKTQVLLIQQELAALIQNLDSTLEVSVKVDFAIKPVTGEPVLKGVKNIIAIASGKGGVGKSTTAVNLALALSYEGAKVGILDADIYGPSIGLMLGIAPGIKPKVSGQQFFIPIEVNNIQAMSMAFLVTEKTPMVWRGPMASGALKQMLTQTLWQDLDYLIVDLPPGTGDIQLTLAQQVPLTAAVIVTTPQDLALLDAKKAISMFSKVKVPIVGIVENMSVHICSQCGHQEPLFGCDGGKNLASANGVKLLGSLPLSMKIRQQADSGKTDFMQDCESDFTLSYRQIAMACAAGLADLYQQGQEAPISIVISED